MSARTGLSRTQYLYFSGRVAPSVRPSGHEPESMLVSMMFGRPLRPPGVVARTSFEPYLTSESRPLHPPGVEENVLRACWSKGHTKMPVPGPAHTGADQNKIRLGPLMGRPTSGTQQAAVITWRLRPFSGRDLSDLGDELLSPSRSSPKGWGGRTLPH